MGAAVPPAEGGKTKTKSKGVRTEGAWIGCKSGSAYAETEKERFSPSVQTESVDAEEEGTTGDEEDEEIWWAWDGKIVGFADW